MKKLLLSISIISILASCGSNTDDLKTEKNVTGFDNQIRYKDAFVDTAAIIASQLDKMENEEYSAPVRKSTVRKVKAPKRTVRYEEPEVQAPIYTQTPPAAPAPPVVETAGAGQLPSDNTSVGTGTETGTTETAQVPEKPKGWSKAAKGAVIGGVGGAVAGAVISKNKVVGAIIGGVVGAGGGYVLGKSKDKKDGRIEISN